MNQDPFANAQYDPRANGYFLVDGIEVAATRQCVHCNRHFLSVKGSGTRRGFCRNCMGITCGRKACDHCLPFEKKLELYEAGKLPRL